MKIFIHKKQKILGVFLAGILIIGVILFLTIKLNELKIINDAITVEAGEKLNLNIEDLVKADKEVLSKISLDVSGVDTNTVGEYTVSLFYDEKEYKINITVVDTKAPTIMIIL